MSKADEAFEKWAEQNRYSGPVAAWRAAWQLRGEADQLAVDSYLKSEGFGGLLRTAVKLAVSRND